MTTQTFLFWMLWFRFLRFERTNVRRVQSFVRGAGPKLRREAPRLGRWLRSLCFAPIWISFEISIHAWELLEGKAQARWKMRLRSYHRALFCVMLSLTAGHALGILITHLSMSEWTLAISMLYGLALFAGWKRSARWLRNTLGVRPARSHDPHNPYAGLDLGN